MEKKVSINDKKRITTGGTCRVTLAFILYRAGLGVYASKDEDDTG